MALLFIDGKMVNESWRIDIPKDKRKPSIATINDRAIKLYNGFMRLRRGEVAYYFSTKR